METEQAIEILSDELKIIQSVIAYCKDFEKAETKTLEYRINRGKAIEQAITALKEVQQYCEIGTVEQVKNQKENLSVAYQVISDYEQYGTIEDFKMAQRYLRLVNAHGTIGGVIEACAEYEKIGTLEEIKDLMRTISEAAGETDDDGINIGFIKDLFELGKYRAIGTPDECREAREKMTPKEPAFEGDGYDDYGNMVYDTWICPNCGEKYEMDFDDYDHCPKCGQAIMKMNGNLEEK